MRGGAGCPAPPPSPSCCPLCERRLAEAVAEIVACASRQAVAAAFEQHFSEMFAALSKVAPGEAPSAVAAPPGAGTPQRLHVPLRNHTATVDTFARQVTTMAMQASMSSQASGPTEAPAAPAAAADTRIPTVQSLHDVLAHSVLEQAGLAGDRRGRAPSRERPAFCERGGAGHRGAGHPCSGGDAVESCLPSDRPPRPRAGASPVASYFALVPGDELVARRAAASRGELPVLRAHRVSVSCGELPSLGNERARRASAPCCELPGFLDPTNCARRLSEEAATTPEVGAGVPSGIGKVVPAEVSLEVAEGGESMSQSSSATDSFSEGSLAFKCEERLKRRHMTSSQVLDARVQELARQATWSSAAPGCASTVFSARPKAFEATMVFNIFGILPWDSDRRPRASAVYQAAVRVVVAISVLVSLLPASADRAALHRGDDWRTCDSGGSECWAHDGSFGRMALPVAAIFALTPFALRRHQRALDETVELLRAVALDRRYQSLFDRRARWDILVIAAIWLLIVISTIVCAAHGDGRRTELVLLHTMSVAISSGMILCLAYIMVFVCRSLSVMIDAFCCDLVSAIEVEQVAHVWNVTQAILRKASSSVEKCSLLLFTIMALTVPLLLLAFDLDGSIASLGHIVQGGLVSVGVLQALFVAATVSEQCARVPAFINAMSFGVGTERARQHTVDYVASSAAGFYVFGMRLTLSAVVKFVYFWFVVTVSLVTRTSSSAGHRGEHLFHVSTDDGL